MCYTYHTTVLKGLNVFSIQNVTDVTKFDSFIRTNEITPIVIAGGGFTGLETAETW